MSSEALGNLEPYVLRIGRLPPLPWFSETDFREAVAIIREADDEVAHGSEPGAGLNLILVSELMLRTVRGLEWADEKQPIAKEEIKNLCWLTDLFAVVPVTRTEAQSIFCSIWAERVELKGPALKWWLKYEHGVMEIFSNFNISIGHIKEDDLSFYVDYNVPEFLAGLLLAGFPRTSMMSFLSSHARVQLVRTLAIEAEALAAFAAARTQD